VADKSSIYRVHGKQILRHDFHGNVVDSVALDFDPAAGQITQITYSDTHVFASTQGCGQMAVIDKADFATTVVDGNVDELAGGGWGLAVLDGYLYCTGNDYLRKVEITTGTIVATRTTSDVELGVGSVNYTTMLVTYDSRILVRAISSGQSRVAYLDLDTLDEGPLYENQDIAYSGSWMTDETGKGFYSIRAFGGGVDEYFVLHTTFATGESRQLSPPRSHDDVSIGGLALDENYFYWLEVPRDGYYSQLVRYPRGKYDEPFVVEQ
jgi:hypothetical protein